MGIIGWLHGSFVHSRRADVLARHVTSLIPTGASVLDVGCGDGRLAAEVARHRPDVEISGVDVLCRSHAAIEVREFDGITIPFPDRSFDVVLFVDVLHHTRDPMVLLREARRVTRNIVLIKDHNCDGVLAAQVLRFMDWVGNARHGVALPYNYWRRAQWRAAVLELGLKPTIWKEDLHLYPRPVRWMFERSLHFMAMLMIPSSVEADRTRGNGERRLEPRP